MAEILNEKFLLPFLLFFRDTGNFMNHRLKLKIGYGIIVMINQGVPGESRDTGKVPYNTNPSEAFAGMKDKMD